MESTNKRKSSTTLPWLLSEIKGIVFDLDGTVYVGERLVDGAIELINWFHSYNMKICMISNNSTKNRSEIINKLTRLGISKDLNLLVINSAYATVRLILNEKFERCYVVGSSGLKSELLAAGIELSRENLDAVVIGLDNQFSYSTLNDVVNVIIREKCPVVACNMDRTFPMADEYLGSGCGAIVSAIEFAVGKSCDYIVGKPETFMLDMFMSENQMTPNDILVIGDQYDSDILMADRAGARSVLFSDDKSKVDHCVVVKKISEIKSLFVK